MLDYLLLEYVISGILIKRCASDGPMQFRYILLYSMM